MKIAFFGTSAFACPALRAIHESIGIELVVTQPDRPAGRHAELRPSPVKCMALELGLPLFQPKSINQPESLERLRACTPDAIVVASYGQLLKEPVFSLPPLGTVNIHASLLPAYRGAAPVHWAIINGETVTGISTFFIERGLDTGDLLMLEALNIREDETTCELEGRLADLGARVILQTLRGLGDGTLQATPQPDDGVSHAPSLTREDGHIDWTRPAHAIHDLVRGTQPWPGAWTELDGQRIKIHATRKTGLASGAIQPGEIGVPETNRLFVGSGDELLEILELQRECKPRTSGPDFLHGLHGSTRFT